MPDTPDEQPENLNDLNQDPEGENENSRGEMQEELGKAISQAEENLNGWKRTQADFDNYRRRKELEAQDLVIMGKQRAFSQLLPTIESISQALQFAPDLTDEKYLQWKKGLDGVVKQLDTALAEAGIEKINAVGKPFDPHLHEAVREVEGDEDGIVAEQYQAGYLIDGKLLRPAQVAISKKKTE